MAEVANDPEKCIFIRENARLIRRSERRQCNERPQARHYWGHRGRRSARSDRGRRDRKPQVAQVQ